MKIVKVVHNKNTDGFTITQGDDDFVKEWVERQVNSNSFGKPQREVVEKDCTPEEIKNAISFSKRMEKKEEKIYYLLPAEYEIIIEELITSYTELRIKEYQEQIDPFFHNAVMDFMMGKPAKSEELIKKYNEIKSKYPKPL